MTKFSPFSLPGSRRRSLASRAVSHSPRVGAPAGRNGLSDRRPAAVGQPGAEAAGRPPGAGRPADAEGPAGAVTPTAAPAAPVAHPPPAAAGTGTVAD